MTELPDHEADILSARRTELSDITRHLARLHEVSEVILAQVDIFCAALALAGAWDEPSWVSISRDWLGPMCLETDERSGQAAMLGAELLKFKPDGGEQARFMRRLVRHELSHDELVRAAATCSPIPEGPRRNDPCPCGTKVDGKPVKFKKCCGRGGR